MRTMTKTKNTTPIIERIMVTGRIVVKELFEVDGVIVVVKQGVSCSVVLPLQM
jgi:hypothetical protein